MPAKITKFEPQRFYFEDLDEKHGFYEEGTEPTMMAFRKATPLDDTKRTAIIGGGTIHYKQAENGEMIGEMTVNLAEIKYATIYACFEESNITGEDGSPALRKGMTYDAFKRTIGALPEDYLDAFYRKAIEVNPQWGDNGNF